MKKIVIAIMLILSVCAFCLVSCGPVDNNDNSDKTPNNTLTPDNTPMVTPDITTPNRTPVITPDVTPDITTDIIPDTPTPDVSPVNPDNNR